MQELGAMAFDILYSKISTGKGDPDVVLPVQLIIRESCGCTSRASRTTTGKKDSPVAAPASSDGTGSRVFGRRFARTRDVRVDGT